MQNFSLRLKSDYQILLAQIERQKSQLLQLEKGTERYNKAFKKLLELVIYAKASSYCLDNAAERRKVTRIIYTLLQEIEIVTE